MKTKAGPLTGLVSSTNFWEINEEMRQMMEGSGSWAQEADAEQLACYWKDAGAGSPPDHDADSTKSCEPRQPV